MNLGYCGGNGPLTWRKVNKNGAHKDMDKESTSPKPLAGKMRRADFCEFLQPVGINEVHGLPGIKP